MNELFERYELVFIVLCYRNSFDLSNFVRSTKKLNFKYKIIVVNSFFDDLTKMDIELFAKSNNCDFLNVPNKGYGFGNNVGIKYAKDNYEFDYLVVSNADIEVLDFKSLRKCSLKGDFILAPKILTLKGKNQNPMHLYNSKLTEFLKYFAFKKNFFILLYITIGIEKILKNFYKKFRNFDGKKIFAAHGSFLIFNRSAIDKLLVVYDENIFLMCEELDLAMCAGEKNINIIYYPKIKVLHKEDGSIKMANLNIKKNLKESYIYYYEKWYRI